MTNTELLTGAYVQAGTAHQELGQIIQECRDKSTLPHECVPALNIIVNRLAQAHGAALELQQRAHGVPPAKVG